MAIFIRMRELCLVTSERDWEMIVSFLKRFFVS